MFEGGFLEISLQDVTYHDLMWHMMFSIKSMATAVECTGALMATIATEVDYLDIGMGDFRVIPQLLRFVSYEGGIVVIVHHPTTAPNRS